MSIEQALYVVFLSIACGLLSGALGSLLWAFGLRRWCLRLELSISDLQDRALSVKGKAAAAERWKDDKWMESAIANRVEAKPQRYDNDPQV